MLRHLALSLAATLLFACAAAAGGDDTEASEGAATASRSEQKGSREDAGKEAAVRQDPGPSAVGPEGGTSSPEATTSALRMDGIACTVDDTGLDTGLDGHGWTLAISAHCPTSLSVNISGVSDRPYPQHDVLPFLKEEGAVLFLTTPDGYLAETFRASVPGGKTTITTGPTSAARAMVKGTATVTDPSDGTSHELEFEVSY
jgi:hypothetical protein